MEMYLCSNTSLQVERSFYMLKSRLLCRGICIIFYMYVRNTIIKTMSLHQYSKFVMRVEGNIFIFYHAPANRAPLL